MTVFVLSQLSVQSSLGVLATRNNVRVKMPGNQLKEKKNGYADHLIGNYRDAMSAE